MYNGNFLDFDDCGRVRIDDLEQRRDVQDAIMEIWPKVDSQNLRQLTDFDSYKSEFLKLFGFGLPKVDYGKDSKLDAEI